MKSGKALAGALQALGGLAAGTAALRGWRRAGLALLLGLAATLALPPWHVVPLLLVGFTGLTWLLDGAAGCGRPLRRAALDGLFFGLGYFLIGIHWLAEAFLVDPVRHGWMIPFALGGLSALLALFPAGACMLAVFGCRRFAVAGAGRVLLLAVCWTFFEWLRGWVLTGFPWQLVGYVWSFAPTAIQPAAWLGVFGLGLMTIIAAAMPAVFGDVRRSRRSLVALVLAVVLPAAIFTAGALRLAAAPSYVAASPGAPSNPALVAGVRLRLVQAGIPQRLKWRPELRRDHLRRYIELSHAPSDVKPTVIVWPETAVPYFLLNDAVARNAVATAVPPGGLLLTGTVRYDGTDEHTTRYWNSAVAISADGDVEAVYDKFHLVPFGEYVPLGDLLPLEKLVAGAGSFSAGPGLQVVDLPGLPAVGPLICYEAIFPGAISALDRRPEWLLNLTNDGWFGTGAGPRQHLAIATMRAVEEGLPLIRAAGTGISAVIDPYGRELGRLGIGAAGVVDAVLPRSLPPTLYARYTDWLFALLAAFLTLIAVLLYKVPNDNDI